MDVLAIAMAIFAVLEVSNVALLYFQPSSRLGNGVGVFNAYEKSKSDPEIHEFVRYLVNWVAGTKLIFILLLGVISVTGSDVTRTWSAIVLVLSIGTYFWRLHPIIRQMDMEQRITPIGYSRTLGIMIASFMSIFAISLIVSLI